jgi:hypothetical protein
MSSCRVRSLASGLAVALTIALTVIGCGSSGPPVHQVKGKVAYKGKGRISDLTDGMVMFRSTSDAKLQAIGTIEDDGSFSLGTFHEGKELPGVLAGTYKARVEPPGGDDEENKPRLPIQRKYLDFDKSGLTFTVPVTGEILVEVER